MMLVTMPITVVNTWGDGSGGGGNMDFNTTSQRNRAARGAADGGTKKSSPSWSGHIGRLLFQISLGNLESAAATFVTSPGCTSASFAGIGTVASGTGDTSSSSSNSSSMDDCRVDKTYIAGTCKWWCPWCTDNCNRQ
jgi:hypothetical protein